MIHLSSRLARALVIASLACAPGDQRSNPGSSNQTGRVANDRATNLRKLAESVLTRSYKHPYVITVEYDKVDDYTTVKVREFRLQGGLKLEAYFVSEGKRVHTPDEVTLHFISNSDDWKYLTYNSLRFLLDDSLRIDLGDQEHRGDVGSGYVLEQFFPMLTIDDFLRLVGASRVEGRLGATNFTLSARQLDGLRDFAKRMFPDTTMN